MKFFDPYVRSVYFVEGNIGVVKISPIKILKYFINLPLLIIWAVWKGMFQ